MNYPTERTEAAPEDTAELTAAQLKARVEASTKGVKIAALQREAANIATLLQELREVIALVDHNVDARGAAQHLRNAAINLDAAVSTAASSGGLEQLS